MVELERRGIPTVFFTAKTFVHDAQRSAASFGLPGLPIAVLPLPVTNQRPGDIHAMVDGAIEQVITGLTRPVETKVDDHDLPAAEERLVYTGDDLLEAWDGMQTDFLARGWSDGFPLAPATRQKVDAMLGGTRRSPADVIATLEPGFGLATVEKLAVNAVMAGCRPEHLPFLIAAVRCLAEPKMYLRNKAMSTGPHAPAVIVNGPRGRAARFNGGICALGPGAPSASNSALGRALRLTMMNVGHTYVAISDMDTIGSPLKYACCCAENERESPWDPYHVTRGFHADDSTVTVHFAYGLCELHDFKSTMPADLIGVFATAATNVAQVGTGLWLLGRRSDPRYKTAEQEHNTMLMCPEHARIFAREGWGREQIQRAMYDATRIPFRTMMLNKERAAMAASHPELGWLWDHPELPVPIVEDPGCFEIAVVGGAAGRGAYFYGAGEPVTMPVED